MQNGHTKNQRDREAQEQIDSLKNAIRHNAQAINDMRSMVTTLENCLNPERKNKKSNIIPMNSTAEVKSGDDSMFA